MLALERKIFARDKFISPKGSKDFVKMLYHKDKIKRIRVEGFIFLAAFTLCIPGANWMILNVGVSCVPGGPCLIPVGPNMLAPSGVIVIGLALVLRDLVQRRLGLGWAIIAIFIGAFISAFLAPPSLLIASGTAFLLSELADCAIYTPLQRRRLVLAVLASGVAGIIIDSALFLYLAFGNLEFLLPQIIGKGWVILLSLPIIAWLRARDKKLGLRPI